MLTALIIGSLTLLHAFVLRSFGDASAGFSNYRQAQSLLDAIDEVGTQAQSYALVSVNGGTYLKLVMPLGCSDTDNDGLYDLCTPMRTSNHGLEEWGQGNRVWFYFGDDTGSPNTGGRPWVAVVSGDSLPSPSTGLSKFTKYSNGKLKFPNIDSMTFGSNGSNSFTVSITASSNPSELAERKTFAAQDTNLKNSFTVSRTVFTSRWRK